MEFLLYQCVETANSLAFFIFGVVIGIFIRGGCERIVKK